MRNILLRYKVKKKIDFPKVHVHLDTQRAVCSLALFISEHASTLRVDHLYKMCKKTFLDSRSGDIKLHRTKCTNIIKYILAPHTSFHN